MSAKTFNAGDEVVVVRGRLKGHRGTVQKAYQGAYLLRYSVRLSDSVAAQTNLLFATDVYFAEVGTLEAKDAEKHRRIFSPSDKKIGVPDPSVNPTRSLSDIARDNQIPVAAVTAPKPIRRLAQSCGPDIWTFIEQQDAFRK